jgi:hypothetical protein
MWFMDWEYVAGFLDGEGTVGMWAAQGRPSAITRLSWYNTHVQTLERLNDFIGYGSVRQKTWRSQRQGSKPIYELTIGTRAHLRPVLQQVIPYLIEKRSAAEAMLQHITTSADHIRLPRISAWAMGWSYMAAFLDGEGTVRLYNTRGRQGDSSGISWYNTYLPTLERMQAFLHGGHIHHRQRSGFNGTKLSHELTLSSKALMVVALEGMLPYLIQKRDKAEALLTHLMDNVDETRARNYGKLLEIPREELQRLYHDEGLTFEAIAERYNATFSGIARVFHLHGLTARESGGAFLKGTTKSPETIAKMKATRAKMWEDPEYAARMRAQLATGCHAPRTKGLPKPGMQGENHPMSKLTDTQRDEMRQKYATGETSLLRLAAEYGVSKKTVLNTVQDTLRLGSIVHVPGVQVRDPEPLLFTTGSITGEETV